MNRSILVLLLLCAAGCATPRPADAPLPWEYPPVSARVATVNAEHAFVVLDFGGSPMPPVGARLDIYRDQELIGVVQLTEPVRGRFATADIVAGEVAAGDEAR